MHSAESSAELCPTSHLPVRAQSTHSQHEQPLLQPIRRPVKRGLSPTRHALLDVASLHPAHLVFRKDHARQIRHSLAILLPLHAFLLVFKSPKTSHLTPEQEHKYEHRGHVQDIARELV